MLFRGADAGEIAAHKLAEPFGLLMGAASRFQAEALGVRLCRHKEQYIYEISLLRTKGRVIHVLHQCSDGPDSQRQERQVNLPE